MPDNSLRIALLNANWPVAESILAKNPELLHTRLESGQSLLSEALDSYVDGDARHLEIMHRLIKAGIQVNQADDKGETPLHSAAENDARTVVQLLLDHGAEVNAADHQGNTPLHWAAMNGHVAVVEMLLISGAAINRKDLFGWTALHWGIGGFYSHPVLPILLAHHPMLEGADQDGACPVHLAARYLDPGDFEIFLRAGPRLDVVTCAGESVRQWIAQDGRPAAMQEKIAILERFER